MDDPAQTGSFVGADDDASATVTPIAGSYGGGKETEAISTGVEPQVAEVVEIKEPDEVPEEVVGWMERLERGEDINLPQPVTHQGQTLVTAAQPGGIKIVLPLTQAAVEQGLHAQLKTSLRWLAEWCVRIIKKFPGRVFYRK